VKAGVVEVNACVLDDNAGVLEEEGVDAELIVVVAVTEGLLCVGVVRR